MARLELDHLTKVFPGAVRALEEFTLDVPDGELAAIVGPSGSGKSTLLRLVAGLERPTSGTIRIGNQVVNDLPPRRRDVAMAFQHPALYPHLSVFENLAFPLRMRRVPAKTIRQRVQTVAEQLSIASLVDRKPAAISGGERQRVALGRVLVREAKCNLYDEPLAHLDRPLVEQLQTCLLELHRSRPTTTLFVTHDQQEALALGQRVVVLAAGRIQQVAPPREVYDRPANRFVAGFFGSPPMNFLTGHLVADDGRMRFESGAIRLPIDQSQTEMLSARADSTIVVGIRPEEICPLSASAATATGEASTFSGTLHASEFHGDRVFHRIKMPDGQMVVARGATRESLPVQTIVRLAVDTRQLHSFQPGEFGARIQRA